MTDSPLTGIALADSPRADRAPVGTATLTVGNVHSPRPAGAERDRILLQTAVEQLPEPERRTFKLVYFAGLSKAQAAAFDHIEAATVAGRCLRAKRLLAEHLLYLTRSQPDPS